MLGKSNVFKSRKQNDQEFSIAEITLAISFGRSEGVTPYSENSFARLSPAKPCINAARAATLTVSTTSVAASDDKSPARESPLPAFARAEEPLGFT